MLKIYIDKQEYEWDHLNNVIKKIIDAKAKVTINSF